MKAEKLDKMPQDKVDRRTNLLENILQAIGETPMVRLGKLAGHLPSCLWAKVEFMNPAGSVKDRMAVYIIDKAEREGKLRPGGTIVENTSGNTGAAVAMVAAARGYRAIFTMPDKMSSEKVNTLKAFGAKVVVTPTNVPADSPESYYETAKRIARETPNSFYLNQYHNEDNIQAHYRSTGPEIWEQTGGKIDCLIAGIGTGGTLSGSGRFLKEKNPDIKIVAVDPEGSVFFSHFKTGKLSEPNPYKVEGIGEDMLTKAMDFSVVDDMVQVNDKESFLMARRLTTEEGIFAGGSSGSAVAGALKFLAKNQGFKCPVTILPDSGTRYMSKVYNDEWMQDNGFLQPRTRLGTVADLLRGRDLEVVTCVGEDRVVDAVEKMKTHSISQLVVVDGNEQVGVVTESDLLRHMMAAAENVLKPIGSIPIRPAHTVGLDTSLASISEAFSMDNKHIAVVVADGRVKAVISKIDLIEYLAYKFRD